MKHAKSIIVGLLVICYTAACSYLSQKTPQNSISSSDAFFEAAYKRALIPEFEGGEHDENLVNDGIGLLQRLGDHGFSKVLKQQSLEKQSAVRLVLPRSLIQTRYPKTASALHAAPRLDWPAEAATRAEALRLGESPISDDTW
jgi:hypothetical protein